MIRKASEIFKRALSVVKVPEPISCSDWCEKNFYLPSESSNTSGLWKSAQIQVAILNAMGSDSIEKVDFFKPTRFGGTKMDIGAMFYLVAHKRRNACFYQPTKADSDEFVKSEIQPSIRDCDPVNDLLLEKAEKSSKNTLSYKAFLGCNTYFKGGHSPTSYERMTLDCVLLDELDLFNHNVGGKGNPTTLSWGRIRNSLFKKQIQTSKPGITGFSLIEKSAKAAEDMLDFYVCCPECGEHTTIEWGGPDVPYGFKWTGRDASTVLHYCKECGCGWGNGKLHEASESGFWQGEKGYKTYDGLEWTRYGLPVKPPRHIAFKTWSGYSTFLTWSQIIEEWYDAQGDIQKLQSFTNNVLARTWDIKHSGTMTAEMIDGMIPIDDISKVVAVTAGVDIQDDRIEIQYVGHDQQNNMYVLGYEILRGDMTSPEIYIEMGSEIIGARFEISEGKFLSVVNACIDTQGHHTTNVHKFLVANKRNGVFVGINGNGTATYEMADKPGTYKGVKDSVFYSIGVNVIKQKVFSALRNFDGDKGSFKIWSKANLPDDYSKQLTAEKMDIRRANGLDRVVFTNEKEKRNEALDTIVYAIAAKAYIKQHRGRQGRHLFAD